MEDQEVKIYFIDEDSDMGRYSVANDMFDNFYYGQGPSEEKAKKYCDKGLTLKQGDEYLANIISICAENPVEYMEQLDPKVWCQKLYLHLYWMANMRCQPEIMEYVFNKMEKFPIVRVCFYEEIYFLVKRMKPEILAISDVLAFAVHKNNEGLVNNIIDEYGDFEPDPESFKRIEKRIDEFSETPFMRVEPIIIDRLLLKNPKFFNIMPDFFFRVSDTNCISKFIAAGLGKKIDTMGCKDYEFLERNKTFIYLKEYLTVKGYYTSTWYNLSVKKLFKFHACCPEYFCPIEKMVKKLTGHGKYFKDSDMENFELFISNRSDQEREVLRKCLFEERVEKVKKPREIDDPEDDWIVVDNSYLLSETFEA